MRYMMIVRATPETENDVLPTEQELAAMVKYNEALVDAGVMEAGEGLRSSRHGARIRFEGGEPTVTDGPFAETKELIAGFWILRVGSRDEALAWARDVPFKGGDIELRLLHEPEDFAPVDPEGEHTAAERRLRERIAASEKGAGA